MTRIIIFVLDASIEVLQILDYEVEKESFKDFLETLEQLCVDAYKGKMAHATSHRGCLVKSGQSK